jgi:hypothetical protein
MAESLIVCTPGGASDNCYVTTDQADDYWENMLDGATWAAWATDDKERALIQATRKIESLGGRRGPVSSQRWAFPGTPVSIGQALHWPAVDPAVYSGLPFVSLPEGVSDPTTEIPQGVREAVCEQAFWLLSRRDDPPLVDRSELRGDGVRSFSIDGLSEQLKGGPPPGVAPEAWSLMKPFVRTASGTRV